jgi:hypothetical protein
MTPFYDARCDDLAIQGRVKVECICGRVVLIAVQGLGLPDYFRIKELGRRLRSLRGGIQPRKLSFPLRSERPVLLPCMSVTPLLSNDRP